MKNKIQKIKQNDNSELITFLDKKFQGVYKGFELTNKRMDGLESGFGGLKSDFRKLQSSIDNYAKRADIYFQ